jgi:hypothetical protein
MHNHKSLERRIVRARQIDLKTTHSENKKKEETDSPKASPSHHHYQADRATEGMREKARGDRLADVFTAVFSLGEGDIGLGHVAILVVIVHVDLAAGVVDSGLVASGGSGDVDGDVVDGGLALATHDDAGSAGAAVDGEGDTIVGRASTAGETRTGIERSKEGVGVKLAKHEVEDEMDSAVGESLESDEIEDGDDGGKETGVDGVDDEALDDGLGEAGAGLEEGIDEECSDADVSEGSADEPDINTPVEALEGGEVGMAGDVDAVGETETCTERGCDTDERDNEDVAAEDPDTAEEEELNEEGNECSQSNVSHSSPMHVVEAVRDTPVADGIPIDEMRASHHLEQVENPDSTDEGLEPFAVSWVVFEVEVGLQAHHTEECSGANDTDELGAERLIECVDHGG